MNDPAFFTVSYDGPGSIVGSRSTGAAPTPPGWIASPLQRGLVFDPRPFAGYPVFGGPALFDQGFPFTVGATSPGISPTDVSATFSRASSGIANAEQFQRMTVRSAGHADGRAVGRRSGSIATRRSRSSGDAEAGNSADQLGQGVRFPSGTVDRGALSLTALTSTGRLLRGTIRQRDRGRWTPVDGFGFVNAQAAVPGPARGSGAPG